MIRIICFAVLCCALSASPVFAQEWVRFRGPNGAGQSDATTIPAAWTADEVLWKVELPGKGNSSPVLWGDRIFLTSADVADGTRHVLCLSARDGRILWQRDYPAATYPVHQQNTFASSTPVADAKRVYCAWATPEELTLLAFDHEGNELWRLPLGAFTSQHGFAASPIVYKDLVILPNDQVGDSFLVAVDGASGTIRWKIPRPVLVEQNASYSAPCIRQRAGHPDELIVVGRSQGIASLDPTSGSTHWDVKSLERRPVGSPIDSGGLRRRRGQQRRGGHPTAGRRRRRAKGSLSHRSHLGAVRAHDGRAREAGVFVERSWHRQLHRRRRGQDSLAPAYRRQLFQLAGACGRSHLRRVGRWRSRVPVGEPGVSRIGP